MRPTLQNRPTDYFLRRMFYAVRNHLPVTPNDEYRLANLKSYLSSLGLDFITNYYLYPDKKLDKANLERLKKQLNVLLSAKESHVELPPMRPELVQQIRALSINELIFHHGNQFLTGAPFFPGGINHTIFFQWGNLFAVVKYVVLEDERALDGNALIHFENMHDRNLEQCVHDYQHKHWLQQPLHPMPVPAPRPSKTLQETYTPSKIPSLTHIQAPAFKPAAPTPATYVSSMTPRLRHTFSTSKQQETSST